MLYPPDIVVLTRYWGILLAVRLPMHVYFVSCDCTLLEILCACECACAFVGGDL